MPQEDMKNIIIGPELERTIDVSLGEMLLMVLKVYEDNVIQVDAETDETLPANVLLKKAVKLAKWFREQGIGPGDSVSVISENRLEFCLVPVAAFLAGATFAPLNPDYIPRELKHVMGFSKPKAIFFSSRTIDKIVEIQPDHPYLKKLVYFGNERPKYGHVLMFNDLIAGAAEEELDETFEAAPVDPVETVATILCSSGTTGLPKGVMTTHDSITTYIDSARTIVTGIVEDEDPLDSMLGLVPFFHSFGFMLMFLNILRGKRMVVINKFKPKVFLDAVVKYRISRLIVPPPIFIFLLKHPMVKNYDLSFVKEMRSGAAPMGKDTERELKERFKVRQVSQGYGMTETTLGVLLNPEGRAKVGSSGKIVPGMMGKVINDQNRALGPYEEGELCFKGPLVMKGYVGDPVATANTIDKDGWLHTGDVAYYDDEQYFFIVDRIKELIKYKGFQVAPAELEGLLVSHPAIKDAAVVGMPDEDAGELPLAFVVKRPEVSITGKEIEQYVAENVSPQKQLRGGVVFLEEIPRNATGKILRRVLLQQAIKLKSKL